MVLTEEVDRVQALAKLGSLRHKHTRMVEHHGATIENQFVLATHKIHVHDTDQILPGLSLQQGLTTCLLVDIVR